MRLFDEHGGKVTIKLEGRDMFVPGKLIDDEDPSIADFCFIPILKHNFGPADTWFLGSPILNDYYTVFDMSPESYIQIGIAVKNDEENDKFVNKEAEKQDKIEVRFIVLGAMVFFALVTVSVVCCKKNKKVVKEREVS